MAARLTAREIRSQMRGEVEVEEPGKRGAIIEAARRLFTTEGYEATTMAHVAREAGVGVGTVYLYFKNKSDLLYGVKGDWEMQYLHYMALPEIQALPHRERVRPLIEKSFEICAEHQEMVQLMGMQPEMIGDWFETDHGVVGQALQAMFEEGIEAGALRPLDARAASVIAYGMVNQCLIQCFIHEGGREPERYIEALIDAMEEWLLQPAGE
jgi:AcrR family transcriptional regulator